MLLIIANYHRGPPKDQAWKLQVEDQSEDLANKAVKDWQTKL